jgi:hypothetical protein
MLLSMLCILALAHQRHEGEVLGRMLIEDHTVMLRSHLSVRKAY